MPIRNSSIAKALTSFLAGRGFLLSSPLSASTRSSCERNSGRKHCASGLFFAHRAGLAILSPRGQNRCPASKARQKAQTMKYIIAIIKPHKLEEVRSALADLGIAGMTVSEVKGFGRQKGQTEIYRGAEYAVNMVPKVKLEIATDDMLGERVVETIQSVASTQAIGDGKIFVLDLAEAVRIRTNETGSNAL